METTEQQELRAHCIQTLGFILESVGSDAESECLEIGNSLMQLLGVIKEEDGQFLAALTALGQISSVLKEKFLPFLPTLIPKLIADAEKDIDLKMGQAVPETEKTDITQSQASLVFKVKGVEGENKIQLNTTALENKISALQQLKSIASHMGPAFNEVIPEVKETIKR